MLIANLGPLCRHTFKRALCLEHSSGSSGRAFLPPLPLPRQSLPRITPSSPQSFRMSSSSTAAPGWDVNSKPFPEARRDASAGRTYKSKKEGEVKVPDPYSWLEQPPSQSAMTKEWMEKQVELTNSYIKLNPDREAFKKKVEENFSYPRVGLPALKNNGKFYLHYNSGLDPQTTIYEATREEIDAIESSSSSPSSTAGGTTKSPGKPWFDANLLSKDGTVALSYTRFSHSGKYVCYGISASGSDWHTLYFRESNKPFIASGTEAEKEKQYSAEGGPDRLPDKLEDVKFCVPCWTHDDKGVFYKRFPKPTISTSKEDFSKGTETDANVDSQVWYHKLGTRQEEDMLVISKDPENPFVEYEIVTSDDGKYLMGYAFKDTDPKNKVLLAKLEGQEIGKDIKWVSVAGGFEYSLDYITNDGDKFYWMSNKSAPNSKIVYAEIDFSQAKSVSHPVEFKTSIELKDLVPEQSDATLAEVGLVNDNKLLLNYTRDVKSELWQYDLQSGQQVRRLLPDFVGTISGISGRREHDEAFVYATSYVSPGSTFRFTWQKDSPARTEPNERLWLATKVATIRPEDFISEQVFFNSQDGTRVPLFVVRHKDTKLDGTAPCWLYAYGGFNIPIRPSFSPWRMTWIAEYGGVLVDVCARGGGEYGIKWHEAGRLLNKHKTFEDVLSAAKYLHENKIAAKGKIIIHGGSNGGMVVAACMNRQTEEHGIGAGVAEVGVMDMLKFHTWTIGKAWCADFGDPEDPEMFDYIRTYSPLHNVQEGKVYPTYLLSCADHDDRVVPAHSFKLTAELQHKLAKNPNPVLLRVDLNSGHGAGKSIQKRIEEIADRVAILGTALGLKMKGAKQERL